MGSRTALRFRGLGAWPPLALLALPLGGCATHGFRLFHPQGPVAAAELKYTLLDAGVMLLLIAPVWVAICVFLWRYRRHRHAFYDPDWSHSMTLELMIWGAPLAIVGVLAFLSYESVIQVNPYAPTILDRPANAATAAQPPLVVDVISTDWQWFFIYPEQHIATIDRLVVPAGRTLRIMLTSTSVTNDFFIPQIAPMIDVMPSMQTVDVFRADKLGTFTGFSANFSGAGFSWMQFATQVVTAADFDAWAAGVRSGRATPDAGLLTYARFQKLAHPTLNIGARPRYFSAVDPHIFDDTRISAMQGVIYPVPADLTEKMAPAPGPARKKLQAHPS